MKRFLTIALAMVILLIASSIAASPPATAAQGGATVRQAAITDSKVVFAIQQNVHVTVAVHIDLCANFANAPPVNALTKDGVYAANSRANIVPFHRAILETVLIGTSPCRIDSRGHPVATKSIFQI